jgi:hypothetical protein
MVSNWSRVLTPHPLNLSRCLPTSRPERRIEIVVSKPQPVPTRPDADDTPVPAEVEAELRRRLETFDEDAKVARPWQDVLADLKARRPLPQSPR